jgi:hypothetical protein
MNMARDNRTQQEKLNDRRGGPNGVRTNTNQGRQTDAKHQGAAKQEETKH